MAKLVGMEAVLGESVWRQYQKHVFVFTDTGQPIFWRYGSFEEASNIAAVLSLIMGRTIRSKDPIKCITGGGVTMVFMIREPLFLVAVARTGETEDHLRAQLRALYDFIIFTLTKKPLSPRLDPDLRGLLGGTDPMLRNIIRLANRTPSYLLHATPILPIHPSARQQIISILRSTRQHYAFLTAGSDMVAFVEPPDDKFALHARDLLLVLAFVHGSSALRAANVISPVCFPSLSPTAYLHACVSYIGPAKRGPSRPGAAYAELIRDSPEDAGDGSGGGGGGGPPASPVLHRYESDMFRDEEVSNGQWTVVHHPGEREAAEEPAAPLSLAPQRGGVASAMEPLTPATFALSPSEQRAAGGAEKGVYAPAIRALHGEPDSFLAWAEEDIGRTDALRPVDASRPPPEEPLPLDAVMPSEARRTEASGGNDVRDGRQRQSARAEAGAGGGGGGDDRSGRWAGDEGDMSPASGSRRSDTDDEGGGANERRWWVGHEDPAEPTPTPQTPAEWETGWANRRPQRTQDRDVDDVFLIVVSADVTGDSIEALNAATQRAANTLRESGPVRVVASAIGSGGYSCSEFGIPGLLHLVYMWKPSRQYTMAALPSGFHSRIARKRLFRRYQAVFSSVGSADPRMRYVVERTPDGIVVGIHTSNAVALCLFSPSADEDTITAKMENLVQKLKRQHARLLCEQPRK